MKKALLIGVFAAVAVLAGGIVWAVNAWEYQTVGPFQVRRHTLRGVVEVQRAGRFVAPYEVDPQATTVTPDQLKTVRLEQVTWGEHGLLAFRVKTAPNVAIKGRLVFNVSLYETKDGKKVRDRSLRATVDWPAGSSTEMVLSTDLSKPVFNQQTRLTLEPVL